MKNQNLQSKAHDFRKTLTPRFDSKQELSQRYAKFLCENVSLQHVLRESGAMVLNDAEHDANQEQALLVKQSIENALTARTPQQAAQLAFSAGLRWMQIIWAKSLKGQGAPVQDHWKKAEEIFKANRKITAGQLWIQCGRLGNFDSFKRMLTRNRKNW